MEIRRDTIDGVEITASFENGRIIEIAAKPADGRLWAGDTVTATVARYAPAQKAYFLKHGKVEILFPSKTKLKDGETVTVMIERPATNEKPARAVRPGEAAADILKPSGKNLEEFDAEILGLLERRVDCGKGVAIVIDEAEAATVIDVNAASPDLSFLEANRIAAAEIFRQMRLRNLQGQILIDFLRLKKKEEKEAFSSFIGELAAKDPRQIDAYGFTRLGLFELTRAKRGLSLGIVFSLVK
jgi:Ribonuclease G/E